MQHFISAALVVIVSITCFYTVEFIGYRVVALILMVTVSLLAIMFDILPVLIAAILSALIWNFFFIPPLYTFHVDNAEDFLMFLMYFVIAMVNAVLTFQIRKAEQKARDREEKENTIKIYNTLFNSLSHELRTPISTILGSVDTLMGNKNNLSNENQTALLTEIEQASIRLNRQVENLLNISRLESGMIKLNLDWCDMNEMIYSVIQKLAAQSANHEISFTANEDIPLFKMDSGLMEQVLHNIIFNCVQYTPENSVITIEVSNQNDICKIVISDSGNGFPESEIQFAFDKFYRLPNTKTGGTGLGLSIAKGFTEAHKGQIKLENNETGGAKFTIEIPTATSYINHLKNE
jgi:two-component system sensor histidine kinase KdpD